MTVTTSKPEGEVAEPKMVTFTIDGIEAQVPEGTLIIRAAEQLGIEIPRFCDHPLLAPAGACRQCLVEVAMPDREGNVRPMPKPQASCTMTVTPGMVVKTQVTSPVADKAQQGVMELLLMNHPLDCPVCDKGGECPLQNQAMTNGRADSRFEDVKRTFPKPVPLSAQILLDRERCVLCQRCTRFSDEIAGDAFIALQMRGAKQQIGRFDEKILGFESPGCGCGGAEHDESAAPSGPAAVADSQARDNAVVGADADAAKGSAETDVSGQGFSSYFSGNTVQICPVGALTGSSYRFRSRPFDLVSTPSIAEHDSCGSAIRIDHRRGQVLRRLSGEDPVVNEEWITDKDRFAFTWQSAPDRLTTPLVRDRDADGGRGELRPASWAEALEIAARGLAEARDTGGVGVLPGGRLTVEDAYAWSRFARQVLGTNDIDQRARAHSAEEAAFLAHAVAGTGVGVTFSDLEKAPAVLLVGLEAEEEAGVTFLRLRKGVASNGTRVFGVAPYASRGLTKLSGTLLPAVPGAEAGVLASLRDAAGSAATADGTTTPTTTPTTTTDGAATAGDLTAAASALRSAGAVILVGERLAAAPGAYAAALALAEATGARLAWIPRRAGERGGVEAGLLPNLLPGGRPVTDAEARSEVAEVWGLSTDAEDGATAADADGTTTESGGIVTARGVSRIPAAPGLDTAGIIDALSVGHLSGALVGGVELADLPDPEHARKALAAAGFVVSLEVRRSEVTELADVVLPVAPPVERAGSYWNWEGRVRSFGAALDSPALPDHRALHALATQMGSDLGAGTSAEAHLAVAALGAWSGARAGAPAGASSASDDGSATAGREARAFAAPEPGAPAKVAGADGTAVLASWRMLLDDARGQDGERHLAGTAKRPVARVSAATASGLGLNDGGSAEVSTGRGAITLPVVVTGDMVDGVVWVPLASTGSRVHDALGATPGDVVQVRPLGKEES
ncbi:NADH-quinone oxidoreductase subunit G [Myceligenerans pegani]|uniref:NADH-quinone oxidoreductase subunit G n=1 Tax=Myceligenerans pegani TaxID=2776917 RepID=A0ABR9N4I8_9MICO|nr:NADH-quinone oxidoreductase subunit G [Myceligenerans sp. TRM 65318]MBE1878598.1 NADH-quinone oxidoreductase subunit G [Myceligenerans sp. TRM 65318]MBE3020869.1 NADH-quinone oxidoreductase subunit G [Myceligenerans sp. TRM 65318]